MNVNCVFLLFLLENMYSFCDIVFKNIQCVYKTEQKLNEMNNRV